MVDYATRYPEATPLKTCNTSEIAEALWNMWSRLGIPKEVVSDQGAQFIGEVMQQVYKLLQVTGIKTTPFHAQANGLVEKFNGTLKSMMKKMCLEQPKEWDRMIPALLFAYREVPQESMQFSPFELLFGRAVKGPMQILKHLWASEDAAEEERTTAEYVVNLRNN
jgi:transposase InsO family protein